MGWTVKLRHRDICAKIDVLFSKHRDITILDCGCGWAQLGELLTARKYNYNGYELSAKKVKHCQELGMQVQQADISNLPAQNNSADLVICMEVLEHLEYEIFCRVCAELNRVLKPKGMLIITVPADKTECLADPHHKRYVSTAEIEKVFNTYKLVSTSFTYTNISCKEKNIRANSILILHKGA